MRVEVYTHDPMLTLVRLPEESLEMYGGDKAYYEEELEDRGVEIPDTLVHELHDTYEKLIELSSMIDKLIYCQR